MIKKKKKTGESNQILMSCLGRERDVVEIMHVIGKLHGVGLVIVFFNNKCVAYLILI